MKSFELESHEFMKEDAYIKEIALIKFIYDTDCFYVPFFRKSTKDGNLFWSVSSTGVTQYGTKKYIDGFQLDSRNKERQVKEFLEKRSWEVKQEEKIHYPHGLVANKAIQSTAMKEAQEEPIPF